MPPSPSLLSSDSTLRASPSESSFSSPSLNEKQQARIAGSDSVADSDAFHCPDGGIRAWLVVLGGVCNLLSTFGLINTWGAFQAYYQQQLLHDVSASAIGWIGSVQYSLIFLPGLLSGRLLDYGYYRVPLLLASIALVATTFLTAQCQSYWQLFLSQGVITGLACGVIFGPTFAVVSQWFFARRATALGIVAVGSSIGGTVLPIAFQRLVDRIGYLWTMRALGFFLLFTLTISNLTLRTRLPASPPKGRLLDFGSLRSPPFAVYVASAVLTLLGSPTFLTYLEISAVSAGVGTAIPLLSIANASSVIGRVASGLLADRFGAMNVLIPFTAAAGVLTYAWAFAHTTPEFIVIAVLFGISCGAYVSLTPIPIMSFGEKKDVGGRIGVFQTLMAFGALGSCPIAGAINVATDGYVAVGIYGGTLILASVLFMILTRYLVLRTWWGKF